MKTMDCTSSAQSTNKTPTEGCYLMILGGARHQSLHGLSGADVSKFKWLSRHS
jgi:hypothetical protein